MIERDVLVDYYSRRANEYDRIYERPERQGSLAELRELVADWTVGERVLELACGTGYWTEVMARQALHVLATDTNAAVLQLASARDYPPDRVHVRPADAYVPDAIPGDFTLVFAGFWVSHIRRHRLAEFLGRVHQRVGAGAGGTVVLVDNRFVEGSNTPISRTDEHGNTMQKRRLTTGDEFEIVKNFLGEADLRVAAGAAAVDFEYRDLRYFWAARYGVRGDA